MFRKKAKGLDEEELARLLNNDSPLKSIKITSPCKPPSSSGESSFGGEIQIAKNPPSNRSLIVQTPVKANKSKANLFPVSQALTDRQSKLPSTAVSSDPDPEPEATVTITLSDLSDNSIPQFQIDIEDQDTRYEVQKCFDLPVTHTFIAQLSPSLAQQD